MCALGQYSKYLLITSWVPDSVLVPGAVGLNKLWLLPSRNWGKTIRNGSKMG